MKIDIPPLPHVSDRTEGALELTEVESLLVRSSYCVKSIVARAFRQQLVFFVAALSVVGSYVWIWSRETLPLMAMPLAAWLMSLWHAHHVGVEEVSRTIDECLTFIEQPR